MTIMSTEIGLGRWDLTVGEEGKQYPSWVEIGEERSRFVGKVGSARPVAVVKVEGDSIMFSLPPQYESRNDNLEFRGNLVDGKLVGSTTDEEGNPLPWTGTRAPKLPRFEVKWGAPVELVQGDLSNWHPRSPDWMNNWSIEDGMLVNSAVGSDLITNEKFSDFRLTAEYKYPKGSNSGIYLRGRYEFQIVDDYEGSPNGVGNSGAIYGFLAPTENAIRPPDEWNRVEITLVGRYITVVLNGDTVIETEEIPGITGGALDSNEGEPGPIFVQGDHGPVTFRHLTIYPAVA